MPKPDRAVVTHSAAAQRDLDVLADELKLTDRHRQFAEYLASGQARSNAEAARFAGYEGERAKQEGWRLSQHKGVRTYLRACVQASLQNLEVKAVQVLGDILDDTGTSAEVRSRTALGILDRSRKSEGGSGSGGQAVQVNVVLERRGNE